MAIQAFVCKHFGKGKLPVNTTEVKIFLLKHDLEISQMARELRTGKQTTVAVRVMLSQMINGHRYYPTLARRVEERYGLKLSRPASSKQRRAA